ncbi:MAG TPA: biotin--[acetyl-CoA-carboxylase] ligase [Pseudomonadales bacterium]|nr:biotin--[acetyl-CoA-carboxylase] ligase [Pseudomonadales bacterium]
MDSLSSHQTALDLLDVTTIIEALKPASKQQLHDIHCLDVVDSTNVWAMQGIALGRRHGHVYLAEQQTAGRGRRGRQWISPFARNIYLSLIWQFHGSERDLSPLSLAVGVAVCRALQQVGISDVGLKWPNDILAHGKKLGGILLELQGDPSRECQVIIGVGLNVSMADEDAADIAQPWIDAQRLLGTERPNRNLIVTALLDAMVEILEQFTRGGFAALRQDWQALDVFADAQVMIHLGDDVIFGVARGVDDNGALQLDTATGRQLFHGGEVSLRPAGAL